MQQCAVMQHKPKSDNRRSCAENDKDAFELVKREMQMQSTNRNKENVAEASDMKCRVEMICRVLSARP
jgi:hypothetical protein